MSEAQKYQGALYKEKPVKAQKRKKNVTIAGNEPEKPPRNAYVEDATDIDDVKPVKKAPPPAPDPPSAIEPLLQELPPSDVAKKDKSVNVFEFLDGQDGPNASKVSLGGTKAQMKMVNNAPKLFNAPKELSKVADIKDDDPAYDVAYEENGFSYGSGPIPPTLYNQPSNISMEFMTPGYRTKDRTRRDYPPSLDLSQTGSVTKKKSDKKRKRTNPDNMTTPATQTQLEDDVSMVDAPSGMVPHAPTPSLVHSGLTGGLSRMMRYSESPDYSDYRSEREYRNGDPHPHPVSPIKRTRTANKDPGDDSGLGISVKGRSGRRTSILGGGAGTTKIFKVSGNSNDPTYKGLIRTHRRPSPTGDIHVPKQKRRVRQPESVKPSKTKRRSTDSLGIKADGDWDDYEDDQELQPLKSIEYKRHSVSEDRSRSPRGTRSISSKAKSPENELIMYKQGSNDSQELDFLMRERANYFLSLVNKGPDSGRGCSMHKILKRFHRDHQSSSIVSDDRESKEMSERGRDRNRRRNRGGDKGKKDEEEQDLWRMLRLKKNERGEVVLFLK